MRDLIRKKKSKGKKKMKDPEDNKTLELETNEKKYIGRGGWRDGGRPRANYETKMFRADTRLSGIIETLKAKLKSGAMNDEDLKVFEELAAI